MVLLFKYVSRQSKLRESERERHSAGEVSELALSDGDSSLSGHSFFIGSHKLTEVLLLPTCGVLAPANLAMPLAHFLGSWTARESVIVQRAVTCQTPILWRLKSLAYVVAA